MSSSPTSSTAPWTTPCWIVWRLSLRGALSPATWKLSHGQGRKVLEDGRSCPLSTGLCIGQCRSFHMPECVCVCMCVYTLYSIDLIFLLALDFAWFFKLLMFVQEVHQSVFVHGIFFFFGINTVCMCASPRQMLVHIFMSTVNKYLYRKMRVCVCVCVCVLSLIHI